MVFSLVDSGSTCVDDVAIAGSRVCALSLSLLLYLYCCVYLFSVDVTWQRLLLNCFNFGARLELSRSRVTSHSGMLRVGPFLVNKLSVCGCVYLSRVHLNQLSGNRTAFLDFGENSLNTLCRYRPNRVASFHTKHSSDACTDQVSAR